VVSRIFPTTHFGFRIITVERPLRLNFQASPECNERVEEEKAYRNRALSKKKGAAGAKEQAGGRARQEAIRRFLSSLPQTLFKDRDEFLRVLKSEAKKAEIEIAAPILKAILSASSERDQTAEVCRNKGGSPEPDTELRDTVTVQLPGGEDPVDDAAVPRSVREFFDREVKTHVPDA
jgi:type I restriction enzyme M protein